MIQQYRIITTIRSVYCYHIDLNYW